MISPISKKKILIVFGTRPEAIKMAPVVKAFQNNGNFFNTKICVTAQHRNMLDQVLTFFDIIPDYDLDVMKPDQNLFSLTAVILENMKTVLDDFKPDFVFVQGDTTTTFATSLAAFYSGAAICHVEAGLRTYNKQAPFPEEINRQLTGRLADFHFAPTNRAKDNLVSEGTSPDHILVTGNTVIDALLNSVEKTRVLVNPEITKLRQIIDPSKKLIVVTGHRRENFGKGFLNICNALKKLSERSDIQIIYPVHLNPHVATPVYDMLNGVENIYLIDPLSYENFIWLMDQSYLIITDSGGIQEEAPSLGKPVLVMRETTERPEAAEAGTVILVGTNTHKIVTECTNLLSNPIKYEHMSALHNPYGDGKAAERIVDFLKLQCEQA